MISVYGASGFIGTEFCRQNPQTFLQGREEIVPHTADVLFLASTVDNYNVFTDITLDIHTNQVLPLRVLEAGRLKYGKEFRFTYVSSWFVYGEGEADLPVKETARCEPKGFYSITRLAGERLIESYCRTFEMPNWKILRLGNVIGVGDKKASLKKNALVYLISEIAKGHKVRIYKEPSFRDFIDVRDCAVAIKLVMDMGEFGDTYNIGSGNSYNVREILEKLDAGGRIEYIDVPRFHGLVQAKRCSLDIIKLKQLGYSPKYSLEDTLSWMVDNFKNEKD